jgi:hypothetical protein
MQRHAVETQGAPAEVLGTCGRTTFRTAVACGRQLRTRMSTTALAEGQRGIVAEPPVSDTDSTDPEKPGHRSSFPLGGEAILGTQLGRANLPDT